MMRTVHGDPERFKKSYWEEVRPADGSSLYFAGDGARRDGDGYFWVMGRVDDVINVSGHRLGTMEIESALVSHPAVAEAAVVGRPDELKGEGIVAFVTLEAGRSGDDALVADLRSHVGKEIGSLAKPDTVRFAASLPKTRSGKIMRRILKEIAGGGEVKGDTTTLEDFSVVAALQSED
jgi:acetyl-CoA synthetase